jgi:hypothetical protein
MLRPEPEMKAARVVDVMMILPFDPSRHIGDAIARLSSFLRPSHALSWRSEQIFPNWGSKT